MYRASEFTKQGSSMAPLRKRGTDATGRTWRFGQGRFTRRPDQDTAAKFHSARNQAFTTRAEVTGVLMAA
jgi:hypothetical protein